MLLWCRHVTAKMRLSHSGIDYEAIREKDIIGQWWLYMEFQVCLRNTKLKLALFGFPITHVEKLQSRQIHAILLWICACLNWPMNQWSHLSNWLTMKSINTSVIKWYTHVYFISSCIVQLQFASTPCHLYLAPFVSGHIQSLNLCYTTSFPFTAQSQSPCLCYVSTM